jgi:PAS domain-containing protein
MWLCLLVAWQLAPGMVAAAPAAPVAPPEVGAVAAAPDAPAFAAVFRSSAVPMLLIDPGSGRIVDANPEAAEFYGHTQAEHGTQVQFKFIQILCSCQSHHAGIVRTWRKFGEIDSVFMA